MKLSLAWIFDHINASPDAIAIADLVNRFNQSVAEIEGFYTWQCDPAKFTLAKVEAIASEDIQLHIVSNKKKCTLAVRSDLMVGDHVLLVKTSSDAYQWGRMHDCGSSKDTFLPAIDPSSVSWQQQELSDVILEIDNKSITHRPDLWSHRGIAREIAALYNMSLKNSDGFFSNIKVERIVNKKDKIPDSAPQLKITANTPCRRLAAAYVAASWQPSKVATLLRLCRIDSRPIDALVDATNYVMFDIGQPMHAFDAAKIVGATLTARTTEVGEQLTILDGSTLELHTNDLILADTEKPVSLAGIMGGAHTGVSRATQKLCVEAGNFEPATIRHSSGRYGKRTEASMRFEKNLDPEMPAYALKRYIAVLTEQGIPCSAESPIIDVGSATESLEICITHDFIEKRLGTTLIREHVIELLTALAFDVKSSKHGNDHEYSIIVPSIRSNIQIPEDIVEEIGRSIGYQNIPAQLPQMKCTPMVAYATYRIRALKQYCAATLKMREISSYAFFDETWLLHLKWQPAETMEALNPVSGNWKRLVTSLIPALLKAIHENSEGATDLRYFEVARRWLYTSPVTEQKQLAGVIYTRDQKTDFYTLKAHVENLCRSMGIIPSWQPVKETIAPWYDPYCVAQCIYQEQIIGTIGLLAQNWKDRIVQTGFVGIFELDLKAITDADIPVVRYQPLPKYPDIIRDVSVLIPTDLPAAEIMNRIHKLDARIYMVELVDFFKKPEWQNRISLSFRYTMRDATKTLTTADADQISMAVEMALQKQGGEIR